MERFQKYLPIVELHHEDYYGGGYPYGLSGQALPLGVRIVDVADVFDTITSNRAYRQAMSREDMLVVMMKGAGKQFDPDVLAVFLDTLNQGKLVQAALGVDGRNNMFRVQACHDCFPLPMRSALAIRIAFSLFQPLRDVLSLIQCED